LHESRARKFRDIAKLDFLRSEGEIVEELLWVVRTPERSWKSSLTLQACEREGPGGALASGWYQSGRRVLFVPVAERSRFHHATEKRKAIA
jgi:hypothetical protein